MDDSHSDFEQLSDRIY